MFFSLLCSSDRPSETALKVKIADAGRCCSLVMGNRTIDENFSKLDLKWVPPHLARPHPKGSRVINFQTYYQLESVDEIFKVTPDTLIYFGLISPCQSKYSISKVFFLKIYFLWQRLGAINIFTALTRKAV